MRRSNLFWGFVLVLGGIVLLLNTTGVLQFNVWNVLFPLFIIILGGWFLIGPALFRNAKLEEDTVKIPLDGATSAEVELKHGAGHLVVGVLPMENGSLLEGTFTGGIEQHVERAGGRAKVSIKAHLDRVFGVPTTGSHQGLEWKVNLSNSLPLDLEISTGASENSLDLHNLLVTGLKISTGASRTEVHLPVAAGLTKVNVEAGMAEVILNVPEGVAARIRLDTGLSGKNINTARFPQVGAGYESPDYDSAANRVEIHVEAGVGSITIQ